MSHQADLFRQGRERGELGARRAADRAELLAPGWETGARAAFASFATNVGAPFTTEEVRDWADWLSEPPDRRAWGAVAQHFARAGLIRRAGYRPHKDPSRHAAPSTVWEWCERGAGPLHAAAHGTGPAQADSTEQ